MINIDGIPLSEAGNEQRYAGDDLLIAEDQDELVDGAAPLL